MEIKPDKMVDSTAFLKSVESFVQEHKCTYLEAVIHLSEEAGIEMETAASIVKTSPRAKSFMQEAAEDLNYLPKTARLKF